MTVIIMIIASIYEGLPGAWQCAKLFSCFTLLNLHNKLICEVGIVIFITHLQMRKLRIVKVK